MFFYFCVIYLRIRRKKLKINLVDFAVCCELKIVFIYIVYHQLHVSVHVF